MSNYFPQTEGVSLWALPYDFQVLTDARNVENLSAVRRINSTISTRSNIDPRGEGGRRAPENCHIYAFLVLHEVRKCVELFYWNWPGLTLSSPIRFSSADRRTKSIKLKCWQMHKFDHNHRIQHWSEGGRGSKSPQNDHIFSFFVLHEVRKCVELFSPNWRGQSLRSPIRFSSADRCTKSICCNVEWRVKKCKKMTNMKCNPTLSMHQMLDLLVVFASSGERKSGSLNNIKHHNKRVPTLIPGGAGVYWIDQRATHRVFLF